MLEFFQALVKAGLPGLGYRDLLAKLVAPITHGSSGGTGGPVPVLHKQVCIAFFSVENVKLFTKFIRLGMIITSQNENQ